jgi:uncharacterized protein (TIGR00255 family)
VIRSMTGFGRAESERNGRVLSVEVRSVNHRFLELSLRLPRGLMSLENRLRSHLQEKLDRGKINLSATWKGQGEEGTFLSLNEDLAGRYVDALQELRGKFGFREPVTLGHVLGLPDLFTWTDPQIDVVAGWDHLRDTVDLALADLVTMRETEGGALAKDLLERTRRLREFLAVVEARAPERVVEAKDRLRTRLADLLKGEAEVGEDRILAEAAFIAERMDTTEECVRLKSHLDQMEELLSGSEAVGRRLNFLAQELNREANTIGSKANDSAIAREVIRLKEEIEIIREQIQNIE